VARDHAGRDRPAGGLGVVLRDQGEDELADIGEKGSAVLEEYAKALGNCPNELPIGQAQEKVIRQVLARMRVRFCPREGQRKKDLHEKGRK
jgi:hypothetical protein